MTDDPDRAQPPHRDWPGEHDPRRSRTEPFKAGLDAWARRGERRRDRIVAEIQANRRGEYRVPTWVLVAALVAMIAGIVALVVFL
jgi:hypothetical protein